MNLPEVALTPLKQAAAVGSRAGEEDEGLAPKAKQIKVTLHNPKVLLLKTKLTWIIKHRDAELASD